jgi:FkbM family methyltransferase
MSIRLVAQSVWGNPGNRGKRLRKSLAAVGWQLQKHLVGTPRLLTLPNGVRFKAYPDCVVSSALIYSDWPEYHELMFVRGMLRTDEVVIDVGAHVGHISLLLGDVVGPENLFAFEPMPVSFERLTENWHLNGWSDDRLFQVAVGAESGHVWLDDADQPAPMASVAEEGEIKTPLRPLDTFRNRWRDASIGFLKIDVEGYEEMVFRGAYALLRDDRPRLIMFESLEDTLDEDIRQFLSGQSYVVFQLDEWGDPVVGRTSSQNLFAAPEELKDQIIGAEGSSA